MSYSTRKCAINSRGRVERDYAYKRDGKRKKEKICKKKKRQPTEKKQERDNGVVNVVEAMRLFNFIAGN